MPETTDNVKFAADRMLGRLVKWLRVIGQDVIYGPHLTGYGLIRAARQENRLILTRDRGLKKKSPPEYIFIQSDRYAEQLRQVIEICHQTVENLFLDVLIVTYITAKIERISAGDYSALCLSTQENFFGAPNAAVYWLDASGRW
jgi:uncharacterized protein with PIN domain